MSKGFKVPLGQGHVVEKFKIGNTTCMICDDYCRDKTKEEVDEILKRIAENAYRALYNAEVKKQR